MSVTARTIVTDMLVELSVVAAGESVQPADAEFAIGKLTRLIDNWNAQIEAVYGTDFLTFTFTPGLNPHTIGPTGATWTVTQRPVSIEGAVVILTGTSPQIHAPIITLHDAAWWQNLPVPQLETSYPTDGYYDPTWPNGSLYLYPVPSTAYGVQLQTRGVIGSYTLDTAFSLPPGYRDAVTLTLAEECAVAFGKAIPPRLELSARTARARIFGNNDPQVPLVTQDAGMPTSHGTRSNWNFLTGLLTK